MPQGLLTIQDIVTPIEADEIEQEVLDLCAAGGLPTSAWQPGSMIRTFIEEQAAGFAAKSQRDVLIAGAAFGDLATGDWIKMWAQAIYNVIFVSAKAAVGGLTGTNNGSITITLNPGDLIVAHKVTGKLYTNQNAVSIPAHTTTTSGQILLAANEVGTSSNAAPGYITKVVSGQVGLTVTNDLPVLGADEESGPALVARTRAKLGSLSPNGPKDAYDYVARTPLDSFPDVPSGSGNFLTPTSTPITRSNTDADPNTGNITVWCGTADGPASQADCDLITIGLYRWSEPWCVESAASPAGALVIPVTYQVWIKSSFTNDQIQNAIANALAIYFSSVNVGGVVVSPNPGAVYVETLQYVIRTALPGIELVQVTSPTSDPAVAKNQVVVLGTVTGAVVRL